MDLVLKWQQLLFHTEISMLKIHPRKAEMASVHRSDCHTGNLVISIWIDMNVS